MLVDAFDSDPYADGYDAKRLAKRAGVTPGFVSDWFMWRRSACVVGGDEPGDRGLVAQAEHRADNAAARADAARRDAMQAQAAAEADATAQVVAEAKAAAERAKEAEEAATAAAAAAAAAAAEAARSMKRVCHVYA